MYVEWVDCSKDECRGVVANVAHKGTVIIDTSVVCMAISYGYQCIQGVKLQMVVANLLFPGTTHAPAPPDKAEFL